MKSSNKFWGYACSDDSTFAWMSSILCITDNIKLHQNYLYLGMQSSYFGLSRSFDGISYLNNPIALSINYIKIKYEYGCMPGTLYNPYRTYNVNFVHADGELKV